MNFNPSESEDIDINKIDFEWVKKTTKPKLLKKALKILEADGNLLIILGNYFVELQKEIENKLMEVDEVYRL